jgi:hypothetical protein
MIHTYKESKESETRRSAVSRPVIYRPACGLKRLTPPMIDTFSPSTDVQPFALPLVTGQSARSPIGHMEKPVLRRKPARPVRPSRRPAPQEAVLPRVEIQPAPSPAATVQRPPSISMLLSNFKRTGNPVSLFKAVSLVIRQGRLREVLYGVRCFLTVRAAPVAETETGGKPFVPVLNAMLDGHQEIRAPKFAPELCRRFPVHLLPHDFTTFSHMIAYTDDWMIVGEYADKSARVFYLNRYSCKQITYYSNFKGVRHIHTVHKLSDTQVAICTGDQAKLFDIWDVSKSGMEFSRRILRHNGGFLSSAKVGSDDYFGTDFSRRPNYIYRLRDGKRWFFPQAAFTKYVIGMRAVGDRYIVALSQDFGSLGGRMAWTVFDTQREEFIHAAPVEGKAASQRPSPQPVRRYQPRPRPLVAGVPFPQPLAGTTSLSCTP